VKYRMSDSSQRSCRAGGTRLVRVGLGLVGALLLTACVVPIDPDAGPDERTFASQPDEGCPTDVACEDAVGPGHAAIELGPSDDAEVEPASAGALPVEPMDSDLEPLVPEQDPGDHLVERLDAIPSWWMCEVSCGQILFSAFLCASDLDMASDRCAELDVGDECKVVSLFDSRRSCGGSPTGS
jgi:hypothetical protein